VRVPASSYVVEPSPGTFGGRPLPQAGEASQIDPISKALHERQVLWGVAPTVMPGGVGARRAAGEQRQEGRRNAGGATSVTGRPRPRLAIYQTRQGAGRTIG
jgi:hypothetical protein